MPFEASQAVFRSLSSQKESKLSKTFVYKSSTGLAFIPDAKLQLLKFGHAEKANFEKVLLPFRLLPFAFSPLHFFCFSFPIFFSFVGH